MDGNALNGETETESKRHRDRDRETEAESGLQKHLGRLGGAGEDGCKKTRRKHRAISATIKKRETNKQKDRSADLVTYINLHLLSRTCLG